MIEKRCAEHGDFKDVHWSDAGLYRRFMRFWAHSSGVENPIAPAGNCPFNCGLCENHRTSTLLGNIDITNRCNLSCPICFADAGQSPEEPAMNQIRAMMQTLRDQRPVPCPAVQFSGGEPTMREDLPEIVALAKEMGFAQVQVATNGLKLASSQDLCRRLVRSGLSTVYLQFDGLTQEPYKTMRGRDLLQTKLQAIENLREAGQTNVVLVPTLAKGVNDDQVGDIVRFASMNLDVVKGVNFQPVSFVGRIDQDERSEKRLTISDLIALVEDQTDDEITRDDFYPVPFVAPISSLIAAETGLPQPALTVHPCCGAATYIYCSNGRRLVPITRFVDVEGLLEKIKEEVQNFDGSRLSRLWMKAMILKELPKFIDESKTPDGLAFTRLFFNVLKNGTREALIEFHNNTLFLGTMFFQDLYNIDLERLQRCGVHYALPDGRIIPFCSYNTVHRSRSSNK
jgi:7,8-dihydro-6-hydroxymethylpterin dimethyltransferase